MTTVCVCVFTKPPVEGKVKTRLAPFLSLQQACRVHENLLKHCLSRVQHIHWQTQLWSTDIQHSTIKKLAQQYSMPLRQQQGSDLGERMLLAVKESLKEFTIVIIIGSDCPDLDVSIISDAIETLQSGSEVVLAPAMDGGYVLIGLSIDIESVFVDIPWGTDKVLSVTRERLQQAGIRWQETAMQRDIDRPDDLDFLKQYYPSLLIQ